MKQPIYKRPAKIDATSVGERGRTFWSRLLRKQAYRFLPTIAFLSAEETAAAEMRKKAGQRDAAWTSLRVRFQHLAVLDVLRGVHLQNTGKEISRSEALAALMAAGLETLTIRDEFARSAQR